MKIRGLMTWVLGPISLSLPMMCMHAGDGHHTGYGSCYNSVPPKPSPSEVISQDRMMPILQSRADIGNIQKRSPEPFKPGMLRAIV